VRAKGKTKPKQIFALIKPWDYTTAGVEVYETEDEALEALTEGRLNKKANAYYWFVAALVIQ
jgi:hypothetical protein